MEKARSVDWNLGLTRISMLFWGFVGVIGLIGIGSFFFNGNRPESIGVGLAILAFGYAGYRATKWIINGFFPKS